MHTLSGNPSLDAGQGHMATKDGKAWAPKFKSHSPKIKNFGLPEYSCQTVAKILADGQWWLEVNGQRATIKMAATFTWAAPCPHGAAFSRTWRIVWMYLTHTQEGIHDLCERPQASI